MRPVTRSHRLPPVALLTEAFRCERNGLQPAKAATPATRGPSSAAACSPTIAPWIVM